MKAIRLKNLLVSCLAVLLVFSMVLMTACQDTPVDETDNSTSSTTTTSGTEDSGATTGDATGETTGDATGDATGESSVGTDTTASSTTTTAGNTPIIINPGKTTTTTTKKPVDGGNNKTTTTTTKSTGGNKTTTTTKGSGFDPYATMPSSLNGKTIKVFLWYKPEAQEQAIMDEFTKKFGIKITVQTVAWGEFMSKLSSAIAIKNGPDVVPMTTNRFPTMFTKNLVQPVDEIKDANGKVIKDNGFDLKNDPAYDIQQMDLFKWNDKYYGVNIKGSNLSCDMTVMLYNKTLFANKGVKDPGAYWKENNWNWDTFLTAAKSMTNAGKKEYGFGAGNKAFWMISAATDYVNFSTTGGTTKITSNLTDPKLTEAWQFYSDLLNVHKVDPSKDDSIADFYSGMVAMYADSQYVMSKNSEVTKNMKDDWGVVPFPSPKGVKTLAVQSRLWCVAVNAKQPAAATYFIRYFLDPANGSGTADWWAKKEFQDVYEAMVAMDKYSLRSQGVVGFNDENDFYALQAVAAHTDRDQIGTALKGQEQWLKAIITQVENEIPKK